MKKPSVCLIGFAAICLTACSSNKLEEENQALRERLELAENKVSALQSDLADTTRQYEKLLGDMVKALGEAYTVLYHNIDHERERDRSIRNLHAMQALFVPLTNNLRSDEDSGPAFQALLQASGSLGLSGFSTHAFGNAAANGHKPSLQILLNHAEYGLLLSTTVFALQQSAINGNEAAIEFLIGVINDESSRALWNAASKGLASAANSGHEGAKAAMQKFAEYENARKTQHRQN